MNLVLLVSLVVVIVSIAGSVLVCPDEGEVTLFTPIATTYLNAGNTRLGLFQSNTTPSDSTTLASLTAATFSGYAAATVSTFVTPTESTNKARTSATAVDFTHNGGATSNTIYGYYVYDNSLSKLLWIERFDASVTMANNGDKITITLKLTLDSENH